MATDAAARVAVEAVYRSESRRVLATLIRLLGGFEPAEEALHDAFVAAAEQWPRQGIPDNPRAWLVSAGRFKAIDRMRRRARHDDALRDIPPPLSLVEEESSSTGVADDELRLIFVCCHPCLPPDAQIALT